MNDNTPPPQPAPILPPQAPLVPPAPQQAQQLPAQPQAPAIGVAPLPSSPLASYPYRSINIEKFKGSDFQQWKFKLSLVLAEEDLLTLVKGERRIAENERDPQVIATFNKQDVRARSIICQALDNSLIPHVATATSAADMFGRLMEQYERKGRASSMYLRKKLFTARMREGENLSTHLNSISELVQQLEGINKPVTEEDVITIIINSLPPSFENLCTNLEGMEDLSLRTLKSRLLQEEVKRSEKTDEDAHAFNANGKGGKPQKKWCAYCRKTGHTIDKCFKRNKANKSKDSSPNGGSSGPKPPPQLKPQVHAFMLSLSSSVDARHIWFVDSGASRHMCCHRDWFNKFQDVQPRDIYFGDDSKVQAIGIGTVDLALLLSNGGITNARLDGVFYVPTFRKNLFSSGAATRKGAIIIQRDNVCELQTRTGTLLGIADYQDGLRCQRPGSFALGSQESHPIPLSIWHQRLGHVGIEKLRKMTNNLVPETDSLPVCQGCALGKQHRAAIHRGSPAHRAAALLDLVSSDVIGPFPPSTPFQNWTMLQL